MISKSLAMTSTIAVLIAALGSLPPLSQPATDLTFSPLQTSETGAIPENPSTDLPLHIAEQISDDSIMVSEDLAVDSDGNLRNVETGTIENSAEIVGTVDTPPDPLAKTHGQSFIPVEVAQVRDALNDNSNKANSGTLATQPALYLRQKTNIRNTALQNSKYGPYWGTYNNTPAFFNKNGQLFAQQAKGVIDVSTWQGIIDWQAVKNSGVDGAIIRIGYGSSGTDDQALRNIAECKRLGIPFGIYLYSYAEDHMSAYAEADHTIALLRSYGVSPEDLAYPVAYDLENWTWTGHTPPTETWQYDNIVDAWFYQMNKAGYNDLTVYTYTNYLRGPLNTQNIHSKTRWVAQYGPVINFNFLTNDRGWQYTSEGQVNGINGNVDLNAFGNYELIPEINLFWLYRTEYIAVGADVTCCSGDVDYHWMQYDVAKNEWSNITGWTGANWAGWLSTPGTYWLHLEVRDKQTSKLVGTKTIAFQYTAGTTAITGTYAGWQNGKVLLGESSNNPKAKLVQKIYDVDHDTWVTQFHGQWNLWSPPKGTYWTHFEVYTSDGRLAETKTYAFGV